MITQQYETLLLTRTETTDDELATIESYFEKAAKDGKGSLVSFDKWGKYQLAYPVKKNSYGVYALARYELPKEDVKATHAVIESFLKIKCTEVVLRHVTVALKEGSEGAYQKPEPIDTSAVGNLDGIKEGKIEQLLDSVDSSKKTATTEEAPVTEEAAPAKEAATPVAEEAKPVEEAAAPKQATEEPSSDESKE